MNFHFTRFLHLWTLSPIHIGGRLLFLEGVAEVFERGLGNEPSTNP